MNAKAGINEKRSNIFNAAFPFYPDAEDVQ